MDLLHVDETLVVVNKPSGMPVLPDGWAQDAPYLVKIIEAELGKVWIVHRLDKVTSGVLVLARTAEAHRSLSMQFEKHQAHKIYHAVINGNPPWEERTANQRLRTNVGHKHRTVVDPRDGRPSTTAFLVLKRFRAHAWLEARPLTGRTHQIRVHAAALHFPVMGDALYGAPATDIIGRPALHAFSLSFTHPKSDTWMTFTVPHPEDLVCALRALRPGHAEP